MCANGQVVTFEGSGAKGVVLSIEANNKALEVAKKGQKVGIQLKLINAKKPKAGDKMKGYDLPEGSSISLEDCKAKCADYSDLCRFVTYDAGSLPADPSKGKCILLRDADVERQRAYYVGHSGEWNTLSGGYGLSKCTRSYALAGEWGSGGEEAGASERGLARTGRRGRAHARWRERRIARPLALAICALGVLPSSGRSPAAEDLYLTDLLGMMATFVVG